MAVGVLSILIVASRKHYSVDVLIAWYVVPLVFWTLHRRWTTKRNTVIEGPGATGEFVYNDIEAGVELQVCYCYCCHKMQSHQEKAIIQTCCNICLTTVVSVIVAGGTLLGKS